MATQILIAPGYCGSGDNHWQTYWEKENTEYIRIEQRDWSQPIADEWTETIEKFVREAKTEVIVVAHSLGCIALALWAQKTKLRIKGALLVAPPNTDDEKLKSILKGFSPVPQHKLPFPSILLASTNDPYRSIEESEALAERWGSQFVNLGAVGHINGASNLKNWPEGREYLNKLANDATL